LDEVPGNAQKSDKRSSIVVRTVEQHSMKSITTQHWERKPIQVKQGTKRTRLGCVTTATKHARSNNARQVNRESRIRPKPCAMSRTKRIATAGGRSSGQGLRGDPTNLDLKRRGEKSMLGKRGAVEDV